MLGTSAVCVCMHTWDKVIGLLDIKNDCHTCTYIQYILYTCILLLSHPVNVEPLLECCLLQYVYL